LLEAYHLWGGDGGRIQEDKIYRLFSTLYSRAGGNNKKNACPTKKTGAPIIIQFKKKTLSSKLHKNKHLNRDD
jgi:hypothetical protein